MVQGLTVVSRALTTVMFKGLWSCHNLADLGLVKLVITLLSRVYQSPESRCSSPLRKRPVRRISRPDAPCRRPIISSLLKKFREVIAREIGGAGGIESRKTRSPDSPIDNARPVLTTEFVPGFSVVTSPLDFFNKPYKVGRVGGGLLSNGD